MRIERNLDHEIRARARHRCEYCLLPQSASPLTFPIDHIVARQHGGQTQDANLALCCGRCNQHKGPNVFGVDPTTRQFTRLFNPRVDVGRDHFRYEQAFLIGLTDIGRTTVGVLNINHPHSLAVRRVLLESGLTFGAD